MSVAGILVMHKKRTASTVSSVNVYILCEYGNVVFFTIADRVYWKFSTGFISYVGSHGSSAVDPLS